MCECDGVECDSDTPPLPAAILDLSDVVVAMFNLKDWKRLGLTLGLYLATLEMIENHHFNNTERCKLQMLAAWLQQQDSVPQKGVPSWSVLQAALKRNGENKLADEIQGMMLSEPTVNEVTPLSIM